MAHMVRESPDMDEYDQKRAFSFNENLLENDCRMEGKTFVSGYRKEDGTFVHGYCREKTAEEREDDRKRFEDIRKIMSKYPDKPTLKERHELGGGEYIDVYQPMNPLEDVIGGKVKFKKRRR